MIIDVRRTLFQGGGGNNFGLSATKVSAYENVFKEAARKRHCETKIVIIDVPKNMYFQNS